MIDSRPIAKAITHGPKIHLFGYYDISPWNPSQTHHLVLETDFYERAAEMDDEAVVALVELATGEVKPISKTRAFNLQQGSMMHWIDVGYGEEITHNDWEGDRLVSRAINPWGGARRTINGAIAGISPAEPIAMGLNYARMRYCRTVVGYANDLYSPDSLVARPTDDGLFRLDLVTGESRLLVSIADLTEVLDVPELRDQPHWFNHVEFNTDGSRLLFFCRIVLPQGGMTDSLWTVNPDGSELENQIPFGKRVSHFAWEDPRHIIVSTNILGEMQFTRFQDRTGVATPFGGGLFPRDGHFAYSPDHRWIISDGRPDEPDDVAQHLLLYNVAEASIVDVGRYPHPENLQGVWRCDLHPRWSPGGTMISFDSAHEETRQVYVIDLSDLVG